jgi:putative endonuclease
VKTWYVYIVRASDESLYTGITTDLNRRLAEHQSGKAGAKYFRGRSACEMVYVEPNHTRSSASKREAAIKKLARQQKLELIRDYSLIV